jgi:hypothetical protein
LLKIDFLLAKGKRGAPRIDDDLAHAQHANIEFARRAHVPYRQHYMIDRFDGRRTMPLLGRRLERVVQTSRDRSRLEEVDESRGAGRRLFLGNTVAAVERGLTNVSCPPLPDCER